jgi:hypothetical protein
MKMMKITASCFLTLTLAIGSTYAQNCEMFCPTKEGSMLETTQYDAKNKVIGINRQTIISKETTAAGIKVNFKSESTDAKGEKQQDGQFSVKCEKGVFYFDMNGFMPKESMGGGNDAQVEVKSDNLEFPSNPTVGQTMANGTMNMSMKSNGMTLMEMTVTVSDRKIEAIESVTTPAGTFDCYKVSFIVKTHMMFDIETKGVQWIAKNVGVVKMENYDKKGKLSGMSLLTALKN